jgi:large subunit ribosomal protein L4
VVVESLALEAPKTRALVAALDGLGVGDSVLIVVGAADERLALAARNLQRTDVLLAAGLNVYDVLRHKSLVLTREALDAIHVRLGDDAKEGEA